MSSDRCSQHLDALAQALCSLGGVGTAQVRALLAHVQHAQDAYQVEASEIEHLRESEERWRSIAVNPFDFVTVVDADAVFQYVNRTVPEVRAEDLIGRASIYDWTAPEFHGAIRDALASVFRTGKPAYYEAYSPQIRTWFGSVVGPIVRDGQVVALSVQARDITLQKQAELALRDSEERFRQLAESIEDVFFLIEPAAGRVLYTSPAYETLWGRPLAELYDNTGEWLQGIHPEDRPLHEKQFAAMVAHCRGEIEMPFGEAMQMRIVRPDGSVRHVRTRLFPVRDEWDRVQRVAGVVTDVTEAAVARAEQEQTRAGASQLVEAQESERRRIARELHDEVGQTLTSLSILLQSVRECPGERPGVVDEARSMVGDLLDRVRALSLELRPSMLDDLGLLAALLWMFERYTKQTHVLVRFQHRGLDGRFGTDLETAAFRVVQETLTNVARHASVKEVDVRAAFDGTVLSLQIEDAGVGFDAGVPGAALTSTGLLGMRERVALLGGEFFLDSRPGRGTHIGVRLPVVGAPPPGPKATGGARP